MAIDLTIPSVLVLGDIILDQYIHGTVTRISPEAPVPVVEQNNVAYFAGGAANVARNLAALSTNVILVGVIGTDDEGRRLQEMMQDCGVDTSGLLIVEGRPTTRKTRVLVNDQHIVRIDRETREVLSELAEQQVLDIVRENSRRVDSIVLSDYEKGFFNPTMLARAIGLANAAKKRVIVDPKGENFRQYSGATFLTPNLQELGIATGTSLSLEFEEGVDHAAQTIITWTNADAILLTCGEKGVRLYEKNNKTKIPATSHTITDVSGAGDSLVATFTWALSSGKPLVHAARLGNLAGGIAVSKPGTTVVGSEQLQEFRYQFEHKYTTPANKILILPDLTDKISRAKTAGLRIVFTNGCFDLLHGGHIDYLQKAKSFGDRLVIGLNSDASIQRIKGASRPIIHESQRAELLAALSCVDYVMLFAEDTPLMLIQTIQPDILVKGSDYSIDQVVGRETVEANGGRVELVPVTGGLSTTALVNAIIERHRD